MPRIMLLSEINSLICIKYMEKKGALEEWNDGKKNIKRLRPLN